MTEPSDLPVAGWYDDPEIALRLRWWDGARWSHHTRPRPLTERMPTAPAPAASTNPSTIAAPTAEEPYSRSVPYSFTPGSAPASAADGGQPAPSQLGTFGARTLGHNELWNTTGTSMGYRPERATTISAWMVALTPIVAFLAQFAVGVLTGLESTPWFWLVAAGLLPVLWLIVFVLRDRERLHDWGHLERASAWWVLLGNIGYLTARGIVVQRQTGRGWWPLVVTMALTVGSVSLGIFTPVLLLVFFTPTG